MVMMIANSQQLPADSHKIKKLFKKLKSRKWRLNNLYYITDKDGNHIKFKMSKEQEYYYDNEHTRNVILKVRQLGFTTLMCIVQLDAALFEKKHCAMIAHTLHDAEQLFDNKIRYAYKHLPAIVKAANPEVKANSKQIKFQKGGSVTVSTSFRGGTLQRLHVSEFGKICAKYPEKAREIVTGATEALGQNSIITYESTAEGRSGYFFDYCMESQKRVGKPHHKLQRKFFFFTWWTHAEYSLAGANAVVIPADLEVYFKEVEKALNITLTHAQKAWYASKVDDLGADVFREYPTTPDEAFKTVLEGAYYADIILKLYQNGQISNDHPDNPDHLVNTYWDLGVGDSTSIWFVKKIGDKYHIIDYYEANNVGLDHYFKVLKDKGYNYDRHYAPHDVAKRELGAVGAKSLQDLAAEGYWVDGELLAIKFIKIPQSKNVKADIEQVRKILPRCYFNEKACANGILCLESYHQKRSTAGEWLDEAAHDWSSHGADAFRYFAVSELAAKPAKNTTANKRKIHLQ